MESFESKRIEGERARVMAAVQDLPWPVFVVVRALCIPWMPKRARWTYRQRTSERRR